MASACYELLPRAVLSFSLLHKEIHGSLHVFHIQRSAFSHQFLDVEIAEPCRTRVIRNIQRIYKRALPVRLVNKVCGRPYILVMHMRPGPGRKLSESGHGDHRV